MVSRFIIESPLGQRRETEPHSEPVIKKFSLAEQVARADEAAARMDSGFYFTDEELDNNSEVQTAHRPHAEEDNEWL